MEKKNLGIFMLPSPKSSWLRLQEQFNQPTELLSILLGH